MPDHQAPVNIISDISQQQIDYFSDPASSPNPAARFSLTESHLDLKHATSKNNNKIISWRLRSYDPSDHLSIQARCTVYSILHIACMFSDGSQRRTVMHRESATADTRAGIQFLTVAFAARFTPAGDGGSSLGVDSGGERDNACSVARCVTRQCFHYTEEEWSPATSKRISTRV